MVISTSVDVAVHVVHVAKEPVDGLWLCHCCVCALFRLARQSTMAPTPVAVTRVALPHFDCRWQGRARHGRLYCCRIQLFSLKCWLNTKEAKIPS